MADRGTGGTPGQRLHREATGISVWGGPWTGMTGDGRRRWELVAAAFLDGQAAALEGLLEAADAGVLAAADALRDDDDDGLDWSERTERWEAEQAAARAEGYRAGIARALAAVAGTHP